MHPPPAPNFGWKTWTSFLVLLMVCLSSAAPNTNELGNGSAENQIEPVPPSGLNISQLWRRLARIERRQEEFGSRIMGLATSFNQSLESTKEELMRSAAKQRLNVQETDRALQKLKIDLEDDSKKMARLSTRLGGLQSVIDESLGKVATFTSNLRAVEGNVASLTTQQRQISVASNNLRSFVEATRSGLSSRIDRLENRFQIAPAPPSPAIASPVTDCGGDFTALRGEIKYPESGEYLPNQRCTWTITAPPGKSVVIRFQMFSLEDSTPYCYADWLEIQDRYGARQFRFCARTIPRNGQPITVPNEAILVFRSDHSVQYSGFRLTWEFADSAEPGSGYFATYPQIPDIASATCGGQLGSEGTLKYPLSGSYSNNQNCTWTLTAPEGKLIRLVFTRIQLESSSACTRDWVQLHSGDTALTRHCDSSFIGRTGPIISLNSEMTVTFRSDYSVTSSGFEMTWTSIDNSTINRMYVHNEFFEQVRIQVPDAGASLQQVWALRQRGSTMSLEFPKADTDTLVNVTVQAYTTACDLPTNSSECIYPKTVTFESPANRSWVVKQDGVHAIKFGAMNMSVVDPNGPFHRWFRSNATLGCNESFVAPEGMLKYPQTGLSYQSNEYCEWTITVPDGHVLDIAVHKLDLEEDSLCRFDSLDIRERNRTLRRLCGTEIPSVIRSRENQISVRFNSDGSVQRTGFELSWTSVDRSNVTATSEDDGTQSERSGPELWADVVELRQKSTLEFGAACSLELQEKRRNFTLSLYGVLLTQSEGQASALRTLAPQIEELYAGGDFCNEQIFLMCGANGTCECGLYTVGGLMPMILEGNDTCRVQSDSWCLPRDIQEHLPSCQLGSTCKFQADGSECTEEKVGEALRPPGVTTHEALVATMQQFRINRVCQCMH